MLYDSLYNYILNDIHDVLIYLNNGIKVGVVYAILFGIISCFIYHKQVKKNNLRLFGQSIYLHGVLLEVHCLSFKI